MRLLAIDFGTSNTVAALAVDGQAARTVTFDASPLLPSAVFLGNDAQLTTGREALRQARLDPTRFEPNPKRRIDDGQILLGTQVIQVVDVIAAVLKTVAAEVRRQLGGAIADEVRLTHPAQWGSTRQNILISAARKAGLGSHLVLVPEPVAAAAQFTRLPGRSLPPGGTVAVYDLGGGTFDIAVVGRTSAPDGPGEFHVLAESGLPDLGGLDFDQAILEHVGIEAAAVDARRWNQIQRPADPSARRASRALAEDVRAAKETLSRYPQTEVALPDPFHDVHLTRPELEALIRPNLLRSIDTLATTLRRAGVEPARLTGVFLVGGSSRIPLVAWLIQDRLHVIPVALDQPETSVAMGALLVPLRREGGRTVPMAGDPAAVHRPAGSGPAALAGPAGPAGRRVEPAPSGGTAIGILPPRPPGTDGQPPVPEPPGPGSTGSAGRGRRGPVLIGALVAAVLIVAAVVVLVVAKPFGGGGAATSGTTGATASSGSASGTETSDSARSGTDGSVTAGGSGPSTAVGPNNAFTPAQLDFLGASTHQLTSCRDFTAEFNKAVAVADLHAPKVVRCTVPDGMADGIYNHTFLYLMEAPGGTRPRTCTSSRRTAR